ncbi:MAG: insulinase family protein, partial [Lachnospiraceae bacterium]|nr:insulinase family protein [Lachnospiraceae bacterium]
MKVPETYRLLETKELKEIGGTGHVLEHIKSGAHLFVIETEDDNKVFFAGFRTIPEDDTGVPHILEHTVLSGSEKYPVKDPMGELTGSLRTFMNAMTYPDKTVYPIASTNLKSFKNLMEVYTDAVFHPLIYKSPLGFYQEGWHYELERPEDPLTVNGIVYNEMKGDFSTSDNVLARKIQNDLFPDTGYAFESGGDPEAIPDLSYEEFLEFHRRFYHPSNAYIYLYGDMDMEERLLWLDQECLRHYDAIDPKTEISLQAPFEKVREDVVFCEAEDEDDDEGCSFAWAKVVEGLEDPASAIVYEALE